MNIPQNESLSKREREVVHLAADGFIDKEIASRLGITENTLKTYWRRIRNKLGENSKSGLVASCLKAQGQSGKSNELQLQADWTYDFATDLWEQVSDRPMPGNLEVDDPLPINEVLTYFHPDDAIVLREIIDSLASNDVANFFFQARLMAPAGEAWTSTFVQVLRDTDGTPRKLLGYRSVFHDVPSTRSHRRRAG